MAGQAQYQREGLGGWQVEPHHLRPLSLTDGLLNPAADRLRWDSQLAEGGHGQALLVAEQPEQQVFGADAVVAEPPGLLLGIQDRALGRLGDAHRPASSRRRLPWCRACRGQAGSWYPGAGRPRAAIPQESAVGSSSTWRTYSSRRRGGDCSNTGQLGHDLGSVRFRLSHEQAKEQQGPTSVRQRMSWANFNETARGLQRHCGPTLMRRGPGSLRRDNGGCPVSPDLARRHLADLRRSRFAETASSWLSH